MTQSDKICFGINIHNERWLLSFFQGLKNEIIKSGENVFWDFDANSPIWKTYMENREYCQYASLWLKAATVSPM